jgi:hypothetical protein
MRVLLEKNGIRWNGRQHGEIRLQERSDEGITDVEILLPSAHVIIEAKIGGWPRTDQLRRYARTLKAARNGKRLLVALGVPPPPIALVGVRRLAGDVGVTMMRWIDVLSIVRAQRSQARESEQAILRELASLIEEVIGMQHYDREVLIRDVNVNNRSYDVYFDGNIYSCQPRENAEPLFFAPCFTGSDRRIEDGIHYFSRVYFRGVVVKRNARAIAEVLERATEVIDDKTDALAHRKRAKGEVSYLKSLPLKWRKGLRDMPANKHGAGRVIFFLGNPIRLPQPLRKDGKMIPIGFSMTIEHLMTSDAAWFEC